MAKASNISLDLKKIHPILTNENVKIILIIFFTDAMLNFNGPTIPKSDLCDFCKKEGTYKSLSHLLLYNAISDLKKKNIKWLLLGEKTFYPNIKDKNEKELNIEKFKSGFQTNIFRNLIYYNDLK